jgi:hypothetical protein
VTSHPRTPRAGRTRCSSRAPFTPTCRPLVAAASCSGSTPSSTTHAPQVGGGSARRARGLLAGRRHWTRPETVCSTQCLMVWRVAVLCDIGSAGEWVKPVALHVACRQVHPTTLRKRAPLVSQASGCAPVPNAVPIIVSPPAAGGRPWGRRALISTARQPSSSLAVFRPRATPAGWVKHARTEVHAGAPRCGEPGPALCAEVNNTRPPRRVNQQVGRGPNYRTHAPVVLGRVGGVGVLSCQALDVGRPAITATGGALVDL